MNAGAKDTQYVMYVMEEGDFYKFVPFHDGDAGSTFRRAIQERRLDITPSDTDREHPNFVPEFVTPIYVGLWTVEDSFDFISNTPRKSKKELAAA